MEIIMPAAGLSTRFPNMRPKYTLTDWTGRMMFEQALAPFINQHNITIGILKEHNDQYRVDRYILDTYGDKIKIVIIDQPTLGPADTVFQIISKGSINLDSEILIKDCDSFFEHDYQPGNYVCISTIAEHEILKRLSSKSFVVANNQEIITSIVEKEVVSDKFCVGGYKFDSARLFVETYNKLSTAGIREIFVSHIIEHCLSRNEIFKIARVRNYVDVGTADEWFEYNDRAVIFCDIDGTIIHAQPKHGYYQPPIPLEKNIACIKHLQSLGSRIIFTTARPESVASRTQEILNELGFTDFDLISGLPNTKRILINDYNEANPYPRAIAINIRRDSDNLKDFL